jgi:hypothetical protein
VHVKNAAPEFLTWSRCTLVNNFLLNACGNAEGTVKSKRFQII